MPSLALRPLNLEKLKEEMLGEGVEEEEDEEMLEEEEKKRRFLRAAGRNRRRRGGCKLGGCLLVLLLLGGLAAGVCLALKMLRVPVDYGTPLREIRTAFETVRSRLQLALDGLEHIFLKRSPSSPSETAAETERGETPGQPQSPRSTPPSPVLPLAKLKAILAARNMTLESVAATKYCSTTARLENNSSLSNNASEKLSSPELNAFFCSTLNWDQLEDDIRQALVQAGSAVQVSLVKEKKKGEDGKPGFQTWHLHIGHFPPSGGSLSIYKAESGGRYQQSYQVEMASSEETPEERLEVAWILPFTNKGKQVDTITLLMVTTDQRYCFLELFGARQLSCKLTSVA